MVKLECECGRYIDGQYDKVCSFCLRQFAGDYGSEYIEVYSEEFLDFLGTISEFCMQDDSHFIDFVKTLIKIDEPIKCNRDVERQAGEYERMIESLDREYLSSVCSC